MKKLNSLLIIAILLIASNAFGQDLKIDTEASIVKWHAKKVSGEHYGDIKIKEGSFFIENKKITKGKFVIDMTTITCEDLTDETWNKKFVDHLNSDDFFSVEKFNESVLEITESSEIMEGKAKVNANLTIKGISKPIEFEVMVKDNLYKAKIIVDRTLYDIKYGSGKFFQDLGDRMIDDEFTIKVKLAVK